MTGEKSLVELLVEYALFEGAFRIHELPGLWTSQIDERWIVKCNGHAETIEAVPPYCWSIEYNGWPAGILGIRGEGVLCAGDGANETTLRAAIENRMKKNGKGSAFEP